MRGLELDVTQLTMDSLISSGGHEVAEILEWSADSLPPLATFFFSVGSQSVSAATLTPLLGVKLGV